MRLSLLLPFFLIFLAYAQITTESDQPKTNYGGLLVPHVRDNTHFNDNSSLICGGTKRGQVHYMTSQNMNSEFKWYIQTATPGSACLFRISDQPNQDNDTAYVNLIPVGRSDVGADGFFPCGTTAGAEAASFDIPDSIDCDACILEWIWRGPDFLVRHCADISVVGTEDNQCFGLCQNGGICSRGVCVCPPGYSGQFCESSGGAIGRAAKKILATVFFVILLLLLLLLVILLLYWCAKRKIDIGEKKQVYNTNRKYVEFDTEAPNQPSGVDRPAERIKAEERNEY